MSLDGDIGDDGGAGVDTRRPRYGIRGGEAGHRHVTTRQVLVLAIVATIGVRTASVASAVLLAVCVAGLVGTRRFVALAVVLAGLGALRSDQAWSSLAPDDVGPHLGWVRVVDDPQPYRASTRVIVEVEGERFEIWSRRRAQQLRLAEWRGGDWVAVSGLRVALDEARSRRVAWQHVVGEFRLDWASDVRAGGAVARASNRVRASIERAATRLPGDDGRLFRGLVVGDDRDQPPEMIDRFRRSGLSHLTAVSGQNVSFLLAASGPLLRRLRPGWRWATSLALIAWFVALTRFEPSIVRAGVMASLSATAFVLGRERAPVRILALAVIGLVLVDPLIAWSIGFWLSVGATLGVSSIGPWLASRIATFDRSGIFALPLGVTLGAQIGVIVPSVLVFGRLPLVSIPANLLAVPVAGAVMLYGLPAGLVAGWCDPLASTLMFPARMGTRWVDTVAVIGARIEPDPPAQFVGWGIIALVVAGIVVARPTAQTPGHSGTDGSGDTAVGVGGGSAADSVPHGELPRDR